MIKVLHFIHGLPFGGAETLVKEISLGLNKNNFELTVLCSIRYGTPYEKLLEEAGIRIFYIHDYTKNRPRGFLHKIINLFQRYVRVRGFIRHYKPDVIHTHLCLNSYIKFSRPIKPVKLFYHVHAEPSFVWRSDKADKKAAKWLVRKYNMRFITLHNRMREEINSMFNVTDSVVLNNGIDFVRFSKIMDRYDKRMELGIPKDAYIIGHIGRFEQEKNHYFLLKVFKAILEKNEKAFLLLVGAGSLENEVKRLIREYGYTDRSMILSRRSDIPDIINCMDEFVFPSFCEGLGIVLIEAQKIGIKCFASNKVPAETNVSNLIKYKDINDSVDSWATEILSHEVDEICYSGIEEWDMKKVINKLEKIYEG